VKRRVKKIPYKLWLFKTPTPVAVADYIFNLLPGFFFIACLGTERLHK
jgi:hypothetical protein